MRKSPFRLLVFLLAVTIIACCEPKPRNSYPTVIDSSYSVLAIKDAFPTTSGVDSFYYPVYHIAIKNTGIEADSFKLVIDPQNGYLPLTATQYVGAGETRIFSTYGPLPSNIDDSAKGRYFGFVQNDPDSLDLHLFRPLVTVSYGASIDGPESCGNPATQKIISIDSLKKK
jgi:hypothetical protein